MTKYYLTKAGLEEKQKELEYLKNVKRPEVIEALKEARSLGDLSENAEYDAARNEQAEVEGKIRQLEAMLDNVEIVTEVKSDKVSIGNVVTVEYIDDDETEKYTIVGSAEADPFENKISNESPIAIAIIGKKKGDIVEVDSPNGSYNLKIVEIG